MTKGIIAVFDKQPSESLERSHDWTPNLKTGTAIDTVDVTAIDLSTYEDASQDIIAASSIVGNSSLYTVEGGTHGVDYKITLKMTRDDTRVFEDDFLMRVREI